MQLFIHQISILFVADRRVDRILHVHVLSFGFSMTAPTGDYLGRIFLHLRSSFHENEASDGSSDVSIHCSDGLVSGHKLVLASISNMLCEAFKQFWSEESLSILMPDFSVTQLSSYFLDLYKGAEVSRHLEINAALGVMGYTIKQSSDQAPLYSAAADHKVEVKCEVEMDLQNDLEEDWIKDENSEEYSDDSDRGFDEDVGIKKEGKSYKVKRKKKTENIKMTEERKKYYHADPSDPMRRVCNICTASVNRRLISSHLMSKHQVALPTFKTFIPPKTHPTWEYLDDCPSDPTKAVCKICGLVMYRSNAKRHVTGKHNIMNVRVPCSFCGKSFNRTYDRNVHEAQVHKQEFKYHCEECGKGFVERWTLNNHVKIAHSDDQPFQCNSCGKSYKTKQGLDLHMKSNHSVTDERPFQCNDCGRGFKTKQALLPHMNGDNGRCKGQSVLHEYSEAEILAKPHLCHVCKKRFSKADYFKIHMRIHTGEKPYQCSQCPKKFVCTEALNKHMRNHTGETPYECKICTKRFKFTSVFKKHLERSHNIDKETHDKLHQKSDVNMKHSSLPDLGPII